MSPFRNVVLGLEVWFTLTADNGHMLDLRHITAPQSSVQPRYAELCLVVRNTSCALAHVLHTDISGFPRHG